MPVTPQPFYEPPLGPVLYYVVGLLLVVIVAIAVAARRER